MERLREGKETIQGSIHAPCSHETSHWGEATQMHSEYDSYFLSLSPPSPLPTYPSVSRILQTGGEGGRPEIVVREAIRLWDRVIWSVSSFEILPTLFRSDLLFSKCMSKHIAIQAGDLESISTINGTNAARRHTSSHGILVSHSSSEYTPLTSLLTS